MRALPDLLTEKDLLDLIRQGVDQAGNQKTYAKQCGVHPQYLNNVLHGSKSLGPTIRAALGVERVVYYRRQGAHRP
jgi:DNA-binding transcriptional regulator YdaS (Cro superfamily)